MQIEREAAEAGLDDDEMARQRGRPPRPRLVREGDGGEGASQIQVRVHDDIAAVEALRRDWNDLLQATAYDHSGSLTPDYVAAAWRAMPASADRGLAVIEVRQDGELVLLWPLQVHRDGLGRSATHLGYGANEDYAGPILRRDHRFGPAHEAGLRAAKGLADVLRVYNVRNWTRADRLGGEAIGAPIEGSTEARLLAGDRSFRREGTALSLVASTSLESDPDRWLRATSKSLTNWLRTARKRLAERGEVTFERWSGPDRGARAIDWIFEQKRAWLEGRRDPSRWLRRDQGEAFFRAMATRPAGDGVDALEVWVLALAGVPIAACVLVNGDRRSEYVLTTYDPAYRELSPGMLLIQDCARLAMSRGLDLDFRLTQEDYKTRWADREDRYDTFIIACTATGSAMVAAERIEKAVRRFRAKWGPIVKGRIARWRRGERPEEA